MEAMTAAPVNTQLGWNNRLGQSLKRFILSPRWLAILAALVVWQLYADYRDTRLIPAPSRVFTELYNIVASGLFFTELAASMYRIVLGFGAALLVGLSVGILMGSRDSWNDYLKDIVTFGLAMPGLIYALVAVLFFGLSLWAPVTAILATSYPFVAVNIREGVKAISKELLDMGRVYQVKRSKVVLQIILPSLLPFVLAGFRLGFAIAWKVSTLVEVFGAVNGIGWQIRGSFDEFSVHGMLAWALLFGLVMLFIEYGLLLPIERYFGRWRPKAKQVM
ncbi:MAG: ABC transporter permease [Anaerolineae bacterium]|nr:ABC transporter permease [Anaerolineae bacterium]